MMFTFARTISLVMVIVIFGIALFIVQEQYRAFAFVCEQPLQYRLGAIDERFHLSRADVLRALTEAEALWEDEVRGTGQDVFVYSDDAALAIDFVFDHRQEDTVKAIAIEEELDTGRTQYEDLAGDLSSLESSYEQEKVAYDQLLGVYQTNLKEYNDDVEKWNKRGGAPEKEVKKLNKERKNLEEEFVVVEAQRTKVNGLVGSSQKVVKDINVVAANINEDVGTFNDLFGEGREFEQGIFQSDENLEKITIYQFRGHEDLRLVLAHELGHARGIDHVNDETALMHAIMSKQNVTAPTLTQDDRDALNNICREKSFGEFVAFMKGQSAAL